jgi:hypothetical protein
MNVILFMSKALYQTGMAAPQAERENKGPPLSDIDEVVIFDPLRRNPYCSKYSFVERIKRGYKRNLKMPVKTRTLHLSEPYDSQSTPHTAMQPRKE